MQNDFQGSQAGFSGAPSVASSVRRKLVSVRIRPPGPDQLDAIPSDELAIKLLELINDPQSKLRSTQGLQHLAGYLVPPNVNNGD
jgi:hypothetical protein